MDYFLRPKVLVGLPSEESLLWLSLVYGLKSQRFPQPVGFRIKVL
jgi:hypothetical protein